MITDPNPFADGCTAITCYGNAKPADVHLASTIHCVDDEIIGWLKRREQRRCGKTVGAAKQKRRQPVRGVSLGDRHLSREFQN